MGLRDAGGGVWLFCGLLGGSLVRIKEEGEGKTDWVEGGRASLVYAYAEVSDFEPLRLRRLGRSCLGRGIAE